MKFHNKKKKTVVSKKPKRHPDPILSLKEKKASGNIGSSQKKRLQKRIEKRLKSVIKKKDKNASSKTIVEKISSITDVKVNVKSQDIANTEVVKDPFGFNDKIENFDDGVAYHESFDELNSNNTNVEMRECDEIEEENDEDDDEEKKRKENNDDKEIDDFDVNGEGFSIHSDASNYDEDEKEVELTDDEEETEGKAVEEETVVDDLITNLQSGENVIKVADLDSLNTRILQNMDILNNFKEFSKKAGNLRKSRNYYVTQWLEDLCIKFSYNKFLMNKLYYLFNMDVVRFLEASDADRPLTLRTNTIKTTRRRLTQSLLEHDVNLQNIEFTKVGLIVYSAKCAIGATAEYLSGHYLLQGSSSMTPVLALAPKPGDRILDMCCAPGGKTTHIAQIMKNTGVLVANDINKDRMKSLFANMLRMGVSNVIPISFDAKNIAKKMKNFDRVLLDGPCTGTGVISKDKSIKSNKDESDMKFLTLEQKKLALSGADALKVGGFMVYSTCSILTEENEEVIAYLCKKRYMKIVETGLFGTKGFVNFRSRHFGKDMEKTRRYYPHENNMDGFFVAKLQKVKEGIRQ